MDFLCFRKEIVVCFSTLVLLGTNSYAEINITEERDIFKSKRSIDEKLIDNNFSKYEPFVNKIKNREENSTIIKMATSHIDFLKSKKTQDKIEEIKKSILEGYDINLSDYNITSTVATEKDVFSQKKYFLCISSSMPMELIQNYYKQIEDQNETVEVVMNGFIGGMKKIKKTVAFMNKSLLKNKNEMYAVRVQINPKIFMFYGVKVVPALIVDMNFNNKLTNQVSYDDNKDDANFTVVYGAASLNAMIKKAKEQ